MTIPVGGSNKFTPSPADRGQPTTFQPGRTPYYPNAAFSVPFDGGNLVWTLKGPDGKGRTSTASRKSTRCAAPPPPPVPCETTVFGPKRYTRTSGAPDLYTDTVAVPSWVASPYGLKVVNGAADGTSRVSSATVSVNGIEVLRQSDFNQNVAARERVVTLTPETRLEVRLTSAPGSYLTINLCGAIGDRTVPQVRVTAPSPGALVAERTPRLEVAYSDSAGPGEPAASGIDLSSLVVTLDGVDRTGLFTKGPAIASATLTPEQALADGEHVLDVRVRDLAGNNATATSRFVVDATPPVVTASSARIRAGSSTGVPKTDPQVAAFLASARATDNRDGDLPVSNDLPATVPVGVTTVRFTATDNAGNIGTATATLTVDPPASGGDTTPPTIRAELEPRANGSGWNNTDVTVRFVCLDETGGSGLQICSPPVTLRSEGANQEVTGTARDKAGNTATATATVSIDKTPPTITANVAPAPNSAGWTRGPTTVTFEASDALSGVAGVTPAAATEQETPERIVRGSAYDRAGNLASTEVPVRIDSTPPSVTIDEPVSGSLVGTPETAVTGTASDQGSGLASLKVNGAAVTPEAGAFTGTGEELLDQLLGDRPLVEQAAEQPLAKQCHQLDAVPLRHGMPRAVRRSAAVGGNERQVGMPLQEVSCGGDRDDDPRPRVALAAREADELLDRLGSGAGELTEKLPPAAEKAGAAGVGWSAPHGGVQPATAPLHAATRPTTAASSSRTKGRSCGHGRRRPPERSGGTRCTTAAQSRAPRGRTSRTPVAPARPPGAAAHAVGRSARAMTAAAPPGAARPGGRAATRADASACRSDS